MLSQRFRVKKEHLERFRSRRHNVALTVLYVILLQWDVLRIEGAVFNGEDIGTSHT